MTFDLPMPTNLGNARLHWRAKHRQRTAYFLACDALQNMGVLPRPPRKPFGHCLATGVFYLGARMDQDNLLARAKWAMDWLETRGYLENDRLVEWTGLPKQVVKRGQRYHIVLTVEAAA